MKHTSGPWKVFIDKDEHIFISDGTKYLAQLFYTGHPENIKEDANLIASAPDLLKALKLLADFLLEPKKRPNYGQTIASMRRTAREAIAQAEGK